VKPVEILHFVYFFGFFPLRLDWVVVVVVVWSATLPLAGKAGKSGWLRLEL
jgi:hypothetical protein